MHVVKADVRAALVDLLRVERAALAEGHAGRTVQQAKHARTGAHALHQRRKKARHKHHTAAEVRRVHEQRRQVTDGQLPKAHEVPAVREQRHNRTVAHEP